MRELPVAVDAAIKKWLPAAVDAAVETAIKKVLPSAVDAAINRTLPAAVDAAITKSIPAAVDAAFKSQRSTGGKRLIQLLINDELVLHWDWISGWSWLSFSRRTTRESAISNDCAVSGLTRKKSSGSPPFQSVQASSSMLAEASTSRPASAKSMEGMNTHSSPLLPEHSSELFEPPAIRSPEETGETCIRKRM